MSMNLWGFEKKSVKSDGWFALMQQTQPPVTGPTLQVLQNTGGVRLEAPTANTSIPTALLDFEQLPHCVEDPTQSPGQHYLDPNYTTDGSAACRLMVRTTGESRLFCLPVTRNARDGHPNERVRNPTNITWPSILQTTQGLTVPGQSMESGMVARRLDVCRINDQVYLSAGHRDFPMCDSLRSEVRSQYATNEAISNIPYSEAHTLAAHFPRGHFCFDTTAPGDHSYNLRVNSTVMSGAFTAFRGDEEPNSPLEWLQRAGGFSEDGVRWNGMWIKYRLWNWLDPHYDTRAEQIYRGLLAVLGPQIDAERNQRDVPLQMAISVGFTIAMAFIGSPDLRSGVRNAWYRITGTRLTWDNFVKRLAQPPVELNGIANAFSQGPAALARYRERHEVPDAIEFLDPLDQADRDYQTAIANALQRRRNSSVWVYGPPGDGKTISVLKMVHLATQGQYGADLQSRSYIFLTRDFFGVQEGEYRAAWAGGEGIMKLRTHFLQAIDDRVRNGKKIVLIIDELFLFLEGNQQGNNPAESFFAGLRSRLAANSNISIIGTMLPEQFDELLQRYPDIFGPDGRGVALRRPIRESRQIREVLQRERVALQREHHVTIDDDAVDSFVDAAFEQRGYHNPRTAINIMTSMVRTFAEGRGSGAGDLPITPQMIQDEARRIATTTMQAQVRTVFSGVSTDRRPTQVNETDAEIASLVIAREYPTFAQWGRGSQQEVIRNIASVWTATQSQGVRATYVRHHGFQAFERFCHDVIMEDVVKTRLQEEALRFQSVEALRAAHTPTPAPAPTPTSTTTQSPLTVDAIVPILETRYPSIFGDPSCTMDTKRGFARIIEPTLRRQGITEISAGVIPEAQFRRAIDATLSHIEFMREQTEYAHLETMREHVERSEDVLRRSVVP